MQAVILVPMKSPVTGHIYSILPSKVVSHLSNGWNLVSVEEARIQTRVARIKSAMVIHGD